MRVKTDKYGTIQCEPMDFRHSITIDLDKGLDINVIEDGVIYSIRDYIKKLITEQED